MPRDENAAIADVDFLKRIPPDIRETFNDRQIAAITEAFNRARHSVDIRLSIPLPGGRRYMVLLMGRERRSAERRRFERLRQPILTVMNVVTLGTFGILAFFFVVGFVHLIFS